MIPPGWMLTVDQKDNSWRVRLSHQAGENRLIREGTGQLDWSAFNEVLSLMVKALRDCEVIA